MSKALTIRNLDEGVKRKLRLQAECHERSMEAEARDILAAAVGQATKPPQTPEELRERLKGVRCLWQDRGTTDELMKLTRGEDLGME